MSDTVPIIAFTPYNYPLFTFYVPLKFRKMKNLHNVSQLSGSERTNAVKEKRKENEIERDGDDTGKYSQV